MSIATEQAVPYSSGTAPPRLMAPANSADCHIHIYDARYEPRVERFPDATVAAYRLLQKRIGFSRVVIVTPRHYGVDNSVTLDAVRELGIANARAVAVVKPNVTDEELKRLDRAGVRGIRFTVGRPDTAVTSIDMIEPLAERIAGLGWHVQLNMESDQIADNGDMLKHLPTPVVFDHLGKLGTSGLEHPAYRVMRDMLDGGRAWVKISGAYMNTRIGPPTYADATKAAQEFVKVAPERCVWGSDWPHPTPEVPPDDALLFDLLSTWAPDEATRKRILVTNPELLYGFGH